MDILDLNAVIHYCIEWGLIIPVHSQVCGALEEAMYID